MIFLPPFQGTFFFRRGAARLTAAFDCVSMLLGVMSRPIVGVLDPSIILAIGVDSVVVSGVALSSDDAMAEASVDFFSLALAWRSVSLLDCLPKPRETCLLRALFFFRLALGVLTMSSPNQAASSAENESLNEEFSLSPSLNQCRLSCSTVPPAVCWRIQPSVMPWAMRRARLARTVAAALISGSRSSGWESCVGGAGRRKGVGSSRRWIGESSDASLLRLWLLELRERRLGGYGEPQGFSPSCATPVSSDPAGLSGGVLSRPRTRSGSLGAGRGGSSGDASPSAVEALESAGDEVGDLYESQGWASRPSRAGARGGVCGDSFADSVVVGGSGDAGRRVSHHGLPAAPPDEKGWNGAWLSTTQARHAPSVNLPSMRSAQTSPWSPTLSLCPVVLRTPPHVVPAPEKSTTLSVGAGQMVGRSGNSQGCAAQSRWWADQGRDASWAVMRQLSGGRIEQKRGDKLNGANYCTSD